MSESLFTSKSYVAKLHFYCFYGIIVSIEYNTDKQH